MSYANCSSWCDLGVVLQGTQVHYIGVLLRKDALYAEVVYGKRRGRTRTLVWNAERYWCKTTGV